MALLEMAGTIVISVRCNSGNNPINWFKYRKSGSPCRILTLTLHAARYFGGIICTPVRTGALLRDRYTQLMDERFLTSTQLLPVCVTISRKHWVTFLSPVFGGPQLEPILLKAPPSASANGSPTQQCGSRKTIRPHYRWSIYRILTITCND